MESIKNTIISILTNKWVVVFSIVLFAVYLIGNIQNEQYAMINPLNGAANFPSGIYSLENKYGNVSSESIAAIPQLTTNNVTHSNGSSPFSDKWAFKRVTDGVYLIRKPRADLQGAECLYSSTDHSIRGYIVSDPKVCGMETLNEKNELDPYSIRLYFKIIRAEDEKVVIQSLQNNMYLSYNGSKLGLRSSVDDSCYFNIV